MHGQITFYVTLIIIKSLFSKCLIFKSSSGEYFAVKNIKLPSKCWNGKIFRSSDSQILYCLESQSAKHDSFICVLDDSLIINSRDENQMDYKLTKDPYFQSVIPGRVSNPILDIYKRITLFFIQKTILFYSQKEVHWLLLSFPFQNVIFDGLIRRGPRGQPYAR